MIDDQTGGPIPPGDAADPGDAEGGAPGVTGSPNGGGGGAGGALPEGYPLHWVADVLGSDGRAVHLRPIMPADGDRVVRFHESLSERTRYLRYFGPYPTIAPRELAKMTHVDYRSRVNLVAMLGDDIIAIGLYEQLLTVGDGKSAEVAFVVSDHHQGRGLGSILLEHLAGAAAEAGITRFEAEVLAENRQMISVFRQAGYEVKRSFDGGSLHLEFAIDPSEALMTVRNARESAAEARSVRRALHPTSVALIGASSDPTKIGGTVLQNLLRSGFAGPVYPVNAEAASVGGVRAYATVRDIPDDVDLAIVAVPAQSMDTVLDDCLAKGVSTLVVLSSGFSDIGEDGTDSEKRLVHAARAHGMRVIGPNALGVINTDGEVRFNGTLAEHVPGLGRTGFFCQSGALGIAILDAAARRGLGLSTFVSAGNRADVSGNDLLQYWDTDPRTEVVLLYLESFGNPRKFSRIARRVARGKPVIVVKGGHHAVTPAIAAHATAIDEASLDTLFAESGVIKVDSISQMFDTAVLVAHQPLPRGPRVAVVGNSTAIGTLAVDAALDEGLEVPVRMDLGVRATAEEFAAEVSKAVADDAVDSVMAVFVPPVAVDVEPYAAALREAVKDSAKPVLSTFLATDGIPDVLAVHDENGNLQRGSIPSYLFPEQGIRALARVWRYARWRSAPLGEMRRPEGIDVERARALVSEAMAAAPGGRVALEDAVVNELLALYGIDVVPYTRVHGVDEAVAAAGDLGYPVALKVIGNDWRLRSDMTGVRLDLHDEGELRAAYADLCTYCEEGEALHVQRMAEKGMPCVIGVQDDPSFGSLVSFGLSGVLTDLLGDHAYRIIPVTTEEARELVTAPRAAPLLRGYKGSEPVDTAAIADIIERVSTLVDDIPEIRQLVLDPVLASASGAPVTYATAVVGAVPTRQDVGPRRLR